MKARQEYLLCTSFLQLDTQSKNVKKKKKKQTNPEDPTALTKTCCDL